MESDLGPVIGSWEQPKMITKTMPRPHLVERIKDALITTLVVSAISLGLFFLVVLLWVFLLLTAHASELPQSCVQLAEQHGHQLPKTDAEKRRAKIEVRVAALLGNQQAKQCLRDLKKSG